MTLLDYSLADRVATITMDDGKANALSPAMLAAWMRRSTVPRTVTPSPSYSLAVPADSQEGSTSPCSPPADPRRTACSDPASSWSSVSSASRVQSSSPAPATPWPWGRSCCVPATTEWGRPANSRLQANEVAIGLTMPYSAVAILRYRLTPAAFDRAVGLAEVFAPIDAVAAGWLDAIVEPDAVVCTPPNPSPPPSLASTPPPTPVRSSAPGPRCSPRSVAASTPSSAGRTETLPRRHALERSPAAGPVATGRRRQMAATPRTVRRVEADLAENTGSCKWRLYDVRGPTNLDVSARPKLDTSRTVVRACLRRRPGARPGPGGGLHPARPG